MAELSKKYLDQEGLGKLIEKINDKIKNAQAEATAPTATTTTKGIVAVGDGLDIDAATGKLSVASGYVKTADMEKAISTAKSDLIGGAPETYDTLKEIADYIADHASVETALNQAIGTKANASDVTALSGKVTTAEGKITTLETSTGNLKTQADGIAKDLSDNYSTKTQIANTYVAQSNLVAITEAEIEALFV